MEIDLSYRKDIKIIHASDSEVKQYYKPLIEEMDKKIKLLKNKSKQLINLSCEANYEYRK